MSTIQCNIVSAEKEIFSENVTMVVATGSLGELGITPGHSQLLTGIKPGPVKIIKEGGEEEVFFLSGGFIEVQPDVITLLSDVAIRAEDIMRASRCGGGEGVGGRHGVRLRGRMAKVYACRRLWKMVFSLQP